MVDKKNAVGQIVREGNSSYKIVGVANDFIYGDMYRPSDPLIFFCTADYKDESSMYVKINKEYGPEIAVQKISEVIKKDNPAYPFQYKFVDDEFNSFFQNEMLVSKLSRIFA